MIFKCLLLFLTWRLLTTAISVRRPLFVATVDAILKPPIKHSAKYNQIENVNFDARYGHGGPYMYVKMAASGKGEVESDHAPSKSLINILDTIDVKDLPNKLQIVVEKRKLFMEGAEYARNEKQIVEIEKLQKLNDQKISHLNVEGEPNEKHLDNLQELNHEKIRLENEKNRFENENQKLRKNSQGWTDGQIYNAMGALSLPYNIHRIFSSTGNTGVLNSLKKAKAEEIREQVILCNSDLEKHLYNGIEKGYFEKPDSFAKTTADGNFVNDNVGNKVYDYQTLLHQNFEFILSSAYEDFNSKTSKPNVENTSPNMDKVKYMKELHEKHKKRFQLTAVLYVKLPKEGYSKLLSLFIDEYKLYIGNDFQLYKEGIHQQLKANKEFGWISDSEVGELEKKHKLAHFDMESSETKLKKPKEWMTKNMEIQAKVIRSKNAIIKYAPAPEPIKETTSISPDLICTSSSRKKRNAGSHSCIFRTKEAETNKQKLTGTNLYDQDGLSRIVLPSDANSVSIDSKKLNKYLLNLNHVEGTERLKSSVIDYVSKNSHLLTGSPEDLAKTKSIISVENLYIHYSQNTLAKNLLHGSGNDISSKSFSTHKKIKLSTTRIAKKASKFTSVSNKLGDSYGKIMLAKGAISALRHGDHESLAIMGGRIGLDIAFEGISQFGNQIASKISTKLASKIGTGSLENMAGPIGGIADIGISAYSIAKSVQVLKDPTASVFDQNDAIADIVADSIDIAITAVTTILSMAFPPLAPLFASIALIANIVITVFVGFFKAVNHVNRLNSQIPLLDFERNTEYWRFVTGDNTSGYIQDLIDTKTANNIAVNLTIQLLTENPDFIGRVFPARTMYLPTAECELRRRECNKPLHFIQADCLNWEKVSDCDGYGGYCRGSYSDRKCEWNEKLGVVIPLLVHQKIQYECKCGPDPPPVWGYEILDSEIDFTRKQHVYLQRAAPDFLLEKDFTYLCKPS